MVDPRSDYMKQYNFYISGNMVDDSLFLPYSMAMKLDYDNASSLLSQLGNTTRLRIVRELVRAGNSGMAVGEIKERLGTPNSTLSHHLNHLKNVGLVKQQRESTVLRCFVDYQKIDAIVKFLTEECCVAEIKE